jgi:uncharacterized protein (TIGR02594 family)
MPESVPPWLAVMRGITGLTETPGSASNPKIVGMAEAIGERWPHQADYAALYTGDDIPWCGVCVGYCISESGIEPVFGDIDVERWMWANAWAGWPESYRLSKPKLGCIVVLNDSGHVALYESTEGSYYALRGGNQSDAVNVKNFPISNVVALVWPKAAGPLAPDERRVVSEGDSGADVADIQASLALPVDGDFGPITEAGVIAFQKAAGLGADGVVGESTWTALDDLDRRMEDGTDGIPDELSVAIEECVARADAVHAIAWKDRGYPPDGYYAGMAKAFALAIDRWNEEDPAARIMAGKAGDPAADALAYYAEEFAAYGMSNAASGLDTLRHLFVMMVGLGMRESSGNHWEGRDLSASNVQSETAEAGLFQTSWNINAFAPSEIKGLLAEYRADPNGFQPTFGRDVAPDKGNLDLFGSGDGAKYQWLAKFAPAFAVLVTAVGMRRGRAHWGPIGRREVEIKSAVDDMLQEVQRLAAIEQPIEPEPPAADEAEATITIESQGAVKVYVVNKTPPPSIEGEL